VHFLSSHDAIFLQMSKDSSKLRTACAIKANVIEMNVNANGYSMPSWCKAQTKYDFKHELIWFECPLFPSESRVPLWSYIHRSFVFGVRLAELFSPCRTNILCFDYCNWSITVALWELWLLSGKEERVGIL